MVKITDVAKKANVSISTVSRALNNTSYVSKKTKEKILAVCEELNFKPNFFASKLSGQSTNVIGLIVNSKPEYDNLKRDNYLVETCALEASISNNGFYVVYLEDINKIQDALNFGRMPIDGAILSGPKVDGLSEKAFKDEHIPFVVLGNPINSSIPYINVDNIGLVKKITRLLINSYGKDIFLLNAKKEMTIYNERYEAFSDVCSEFHIDTKTHHFYLENKDSIFDNEEIIDKIKKDSSFIVADEKIARNLYTLIKEKNLLIGPDVGVFSLGIEDDSEVFEPNLSYAKQDYIAIGKCAVHLLLDHINGDKKTKKVILDSEIKISDSASRLLK